MARRGTARPASAPTGLRSVFQPIVDLYTREVVAYEALVRGPAGSPLELPAHLFEAAREQGHLVDLDWTCRALAVETALEAGFRRPLSLFVNTETSALDTPVPPEHLATVARASQELDLFVEITERELLMHPASVLRAVDGMRARGFGVALDDVGTEHASVALMPFIRPDVIKLDLRFVQQRTDVEIAAAAVAVAAHAERTGAAILAEGIETDEHLALARALGATYGQGWLFGRPGPLDLAEVALPARPGLARLRRPADATDATPFDIVSAARPVRTGARDFLLALSDRLEDFARLTAARSVVLANHRHARYLAGREARYAELATSCAFVAVLGEDIPDEPAPGVHGTAFDPADRACHEFSCVVIGPHFSGAIVARDAGDGQYEFVLTYARHLALEAGRALMRRMRA